MERFYTLFIATDELLTSPPIQMYSNLHDLTLSVGVPEMVTFLLPSYIHSFHHGDVCILFDPDRVEIERATIHERHGERRLYTSITLTVTPRDIGSTSIGFASPKDAEAYPLQVLEPQFIKNKPMPRSSSRAI